VVGDFVQRVEEHGNSCQRPVVSCQSAAASYQLSVVSTQHSVSSTEDPRTVTSAEGSNRNH
jgi:hypothetical protein